MTTRSRAAFRPPFAAGAVLSRAFPRLRDRPPLAVLGGCTSEQFQKGYILRNAPNRFPIGASPDQVLIVMGTPSTWPPSAARCSIHLPAQRASVAS